ncbi:hypothetical protein MMC17_000226, partial [Xylographa soralifera]|nr:hypothetical protein [Xylographa soralifera]
IRYAYGIEPHDTSTRPDPANLSTLACAIECGFDWMEQAWSITEDQLLDEIQQNFSQIEHLTSPCLEHLFDLRNSTPRGIAVFRFLVCIVVLGKYWEMSTIVSTGPIGPKAICDLKLVDDDYCVPGPSEHKLYREIEYKRFGKAQTVLAVPAVLAAEEFTLSDRLWLLEKMKQDCWIVKEKVCLLGCLGLDPSDDTINLRTGQIVVA